MDAKGRVALPTRFRELVHDCCSGRLVITIDMDQKCLSIYPVSEWETIERQISDLSSLDPLALRMKRLLIGHATDVELDASDRLLIPPPLRQFAELDKKTVLIGLGKKLELWSESAWEEGRDQWLQSGTGTSGEHSEKMTSISF
jgi:MraZ protein